MEHVARERQLFKETRERNTIDAMLRTAQQHHVALSSMADVKANILITISPIVLTIALGRFEDPLMRWPLLTLCTFTLVALFLAIITVLPKYQRFRPSDINSPQAKNFNLLFFGHFSALSRQEYLEEMVRICEDEGSPYAVWVADIYSLGTYLVDYKYPYLRMSYFFFLTGFLIAALECLWLLFSH